MSERTYILALSGGIDSAVTLHYLLSTGACVHCILFTYGSKHNSYENQAAHAIIKHMAHTYPAKVFEHAIDLTSAMSGIESALMKGGDDVPEGHYHQKNMQKTVVPGRNLIFLSLMAGIAESMNIENTYVALGVHQGDHFIYPDCRKSFVLSAAATIHLSSDGRVGLVTPLIDMDKEQIVSTGLEFETPLHLTRTCYKDQPIACGACGSCRERLEAFELNNRTDPIQYAQE